MGGLAASQASGVRLVAGKSWSGLYLKNCEILDIGWGCRCVMSWCDLDLSFDIVIVTLSLKILCVLHLRNCNV